MKPLHNLVTTGKTMSLSEINLSGLDIGMAKDLTDFFFRISGMDIPGLRE
jgi:hypothetical protein